MVFVRKIWLVMLVVIAGFFIASAHRSEAMEGGIALRNAVGTPSVLNTGTTNVTNAAWVQLVAQASRTYACSGIAITNSGAQPLLLAKGSAGVEVTTGVLVPASSGAAGIIPVNLPKNVRLSVKSAGDNQSSGWVTFSCYQ